MTTEEVLAELKSYGSETTKKTLFKHGAKEPFWGVKVGDLKKIQKKIKKDYELSLELYKTGNSDAMYFAGLIADEEKMKKSDLQKWVKGAYWSYISEYTVPWIAAESKFGFELAREWIDSKNENIASAGWSTYSNLFMLKPDDEFDIKEIKKLLKRVEKEIHGERNRVRYTMNNFVISCGGSIKVLTDDAIKIAAKIGEVSVDMGGTACKVPLADEYINKMISKGKHGYKKKTVRC